MNKVTAIVQARMGSTRLPKKVMSDISGKPLLWHVLNRTKNASLIDNIIIATTEKIEDDIIEEFAKKNFTGVFRGSEENVLDRYYQAAKKYQAKNIVRITADDPLKDPIIIDKIIKTFLQNNVDYVSNTIVPTYPLGLDTEIFSFNALERAWNEAKKSYEREHVTPFIWQNPKRFKLINVECELGDFSSFRWTVDTKEDLEFIRTIYRGLYREGNIFFMNDILNFLERFPELKKINDDIKAKTLSV